MKVGARLNSKHGEMCVCELIRKTGDNAYIIKTHEDVICTAINNPFAGCYYGDDVWGIVKEGSE